MGEGGAFFRRQANKVGFVARCDIDIGGVYGGETERFAASPFLPSLPRVPPFGKKKVAPGSRGNRGESGRGGKRGCIQFLCSSATKQKTNM